MGQRRPGRPSVSATPSSLSAGWLQRWVVTSRTDHHGSMPDFLTVEEAARVLRIGRTVAYQLAQQFRATGGTEGLPVIALGHQLRVPRARLEQWAGAQLHATAVPSSEPTPPSTPVVAPSASRSRRPRSSRPADQAALPFTA